MTGMYRDTVHSPARKALGILGWAVLLLGLPLALLAALHPPNEYEATLGIIALDCDGPGETYLLALPVLLIYGAGLAVHGPRSRKLLNAMVAVLCFGICAAVAVNVARAVLEERRQAVDCRPI
jgi:hypothetical protein